MSFEPSTAAHRDEEGGDPYTKQPGIDLTHIDFAQFPAAPWFLDDVRQAFADPRAPYTPHEGDEGIREALRRRVSEFLGRSISQDEIMLTTGVQNGLYLVLKALVRAGDRVGVPDPEYLLMQETAESAGAHVVQLPIDWADGVARLDPGRTTVAAGGLRGVALTSPNNPTGAVWTEESLRELAELLDPEDGFLVVDELYARVVFDRPMVHPAAICSPPRRVVTLLGPSKVESLSGLRIGVAVGPAPVISAMITHLRLVTLRAPAYAQFALRRWFTPGDDAHMAARTDQLRRLRDLAVADLRAIDGVSVTPPAGGVYLFAQIERSDLDGATLVRALRERARIFTTDGQEFGASGRCHIRLCFAQSESRLHTALERLGDIIAELEAEHQH